MIGTGTRNALFIAVGCLLLAGCGPSKPSASAGGAARPGTAVANAGAGGSPAAAPGGNAPNACGLITEADATTAIGKPSGPGVLGGTADAPQCIYGAGALIVDVTRTGKADYDSLHSTMTNGPAGSWQDVSGVGEAAFEVSGGPTALVYFYKGTSLVEIILGGQLTPPVDAAIAVAKAAAAGA